MCFLVTFCTTQKVTTRIPLQGASRFCKPQTSTPQRQLRTATIKTFLRKLRGSANLDSAHRSDIFAPQQLKPFKEASRFSKPRISTHKDNNFAQTNLNLFSALRRYPCRDGTLRVLFHTFCTPQKVKKHVPVGRRRTCTQRKRNWLF